MEKHTGLRKRQQITKANRMMFLWVAGVSVVVGFSLVTALFLGQKIIYREKVIAAKSDTASTLKKNVEIAPSLSDQIRVMNTNEALISTRLKDDDSALQSVLDALPADANSTALGASLQSKLLAGVPGVTLDSIKVEPVSGLETDSETEGVSTETEANTINFSFTVSVPSSSPEALRDVLLRLEKSIRAINVTGLTLETQGARLSLSGSGRAYYEPAKTLQLKEKVIKP